MRSKPPGESAFTLIEILVVVVVLALMTTLLVPNIQRLLKRTQESTCANNLRSLGIAMHSYANDNNGYFPYVVAVSSNPDITNGTTRYWRWALLPYVNSTSVYKTPFICPPIEKVVASRYPNNSRIASFAVNTNLEVSAQQQLRLVSVRRPSRTMMATEGRIGQNGYPLEKVSPYYLNLAPVPGGISDMHRGGQNILFVDGHVEWFDDIRRLLSPPYSVGAEQDIWMP